MLLLLAVFDFSSSSAMAAFVAGSRHAAAAAAGGASRHGPRHGHGPCVVMVSVVGRRTTPELGLMAIRLIDGQEGREIISDGCPSFHLTRAKAPNEMAGRKIAYACVVGIVVRSILSSDTHNTTTLGERRYLPSTTITTTTTTTTRDTTATLLPFHSVYDTQPTHETTSIMTAMTMNIIVRSLFARFASLISNSRSQTFTHKRSMQMQPQPFSLSLAWLQNPSSLPFNSPNQRTKQYPS